MGTWERAINTTLTYLSPFMLMCFKARLKPGLVMLKKPATVRKTLKVYDRAPAPKAAPPKTHGRAWLLLEDKSTRERWIVECSALLSLLTISNYLTSPSRLKTQNMITMNANNQHVLLVLTASLSRPFTSLSSSRYRWKSTLMLILVWPLALSNLFLVVDFFSCVFLSFPCYSCATSSPALAA